MAITDSYELFVDYFSSTPFSEDAFIMWGLNNIIFADKTKAENEWRITKEMWRANKDLWIRNSGRNGQSSNLYKEFYAQFGKNISFDKTNNEIPTKIIQNITEKVKYDKSRHEKSTVKNASLNILRNYQVSHIWGYTKNPLLFASSWNICFVPKIFDPFTGHEAKGPIVDKFQAEFRKKAKCMYADLIADYNDFVDNEIIQTGVIYSYIIQIKSKCDNGEITITDITLNNFIKNIKESFSKI